MTESGNKIALVVFNLSVAGSFDYAVPVAFQKTIAVGMRVRVTFNRRPMVGFVVELKSQSTISKLSSITEVLDRSAVLSPVILQLTKQLSVYYGCCWGEVISSALPKSLRTHKKTEIAGRDMIAKATNSIKHCLLIDGKTKVHWDFLLQRIQKTIDRKQQVLLIVPENVLVEEVFARIQPVLACRIIQMNSKATLTQELQSWVSVKNQKADLVIGTRSAVFSPLENLGLMIVYDEDSEHYKQEQTPYYHVRKAVMLRAKYDPCSVVFSSLAPTLETWKLAKARLFDVISSKDQSACQVSLIDMTNYKFKGATAVSSPLLNQMDQGIAQGKQSVLFINQLELNAKLKSQLFKLFPNSTVSHYDQKVSSWPSQANIVVATQAILKLREHLKVDLMAVLNIDADLHRFDFRAAERTFVLLSSLKSMTQRKIMIQTQIIDNECLRFFQQNNFKKFYRQELITRKEFNLPPFSHFVAIILRGKNEAEVVRVSETLHQTLLSEAPQEIEVMELNPDVRPVLHEKFRFVILLKSKTVQPVLKWIAPAIKKCKRGKDVTIVINVDP